MIELTCKGCRTSGAVNRVTASLRCTCGSSEFELRGADDFLAFMGATASSGGTGWGKSMPDPLKGWSEYAGPAPGPNPDYAGNTAAPEPCPQCHGSGRSLGEECRACFGSGRHTPPTVPGPAPFVGRRTKARTAGRPKKDPNALPTNMEVVRATTPGFGERGQYPPQSDAPFEWNNTKTHYPSADSFSPAVQHREPKDYSDEALAKAGPYVMHDAACPMCHAPKTYLVKDRNDDAWWHCPNGNCGPLANIDKNPEINPYDEHKDFEPHSGFQARARKGNRKTGRALSMIAKVHGTNPGLRQREVLALVLRTLKRYAE